MVSNHHLLTFDNIFLLSNDSAILMLRRDLIVAKQLKQIKFYQHNSIVLFPSIIELTLIGRSGLGSQQSTEIRY